MLVHAPRRFTMQYNTGAWHGWSAAGPACWEGRAMYLLTAVMLGLFCVVCRAATSSCRTSLRADCDLAYRMWKDGYEISGEWCRSMHICHACRSSAAAPFACAVSRAASRCLPSVLAPCLPAPESTVCMLPPPPICRPHSDAPAGRPARTGAAIRSAPAPLGTCIPVQLASMPTYLCCPPTH